MGEAQLTRNGVSMTYRRSRYGVSMKPLFFNNPRLFCNNLPLSLNKRALLGKRKTGQELQLRIPALFVYL